MEKFSTTMDRLPIKLMGFLFTLLFFFGAGAQFSTLDVDVALSHDAVKNLVKNPQCVKSATKDITDSGGSASRTTSGGLNGFTDCQWNPSASSQTRKWAVNTLPGRLKGQNCEAKVRWLGDASLIKAYVNINSVKVTSDYQLYNSGSNAGMVQINYPCGDGSAATEVVLESTGDAANVQYSVFNGEATNIGSFRTAQLAGESYFAGTTSCSWARTSTTIGAFTSTAACPGPTIVTQNVGTWATTDSDLPRQTITNLPPGIYKAKFLSITYAGGNVQCGTAITDGTTTSEGQYASSVLTDDVTTITEATFTYPTGKASASFELYGACPSSSITIQNAQASAPRLSTKFILEYYPLASDTVASVNLQPNYWSGYHDNTCTWTRTNAAFGDFTADATCALTARSFSNISCVATGSVLPAIACTFPKLGTYEVCSYISAWNNAASQTGMIQLTDGTNVKGKYVESTTLADFGSICGIFDVTSLTTTFTLQGKVTGGTTINLGFGDETIDWNVKDISQKFPAPILTGSITSSSLGAERHEYARINNNGTASIAYQSGDWITSCTRSVAGVVSCTLKTGYFSAAPICTATLIALSGNIWMNSTTTTNATTYIRNQSNTDTDNDYYLQCSGPR